MRRDLSAQGNGSCHVVYGLGFIWGLVISGWVESLNCKVKGFEAQDLQGIFGSRFRVQGSGCRVQGSGCRVRVQGLGFRVQGLGFRV